MTAKDKGETTDGEKKMTGEGAPKGETAPMEKGPEALPTLDDLFASAQGSSCSIDGTCD